MRGVFKAGVIVALITIVIAPAIYADPLEIRILPPTGLTAQADPSQVRSGPPGGLRILFWVWWQIRIGPPIG